jgi:penicillin-binding protein activator
MYKAIKLSFLFTVLLIAGVGCRTKTVTRVNPNQQIDLSGRWNDTDSKLVAEEMIRDVIERPWRSEFSYKKNRRPVVIVGVITNRSHEHIEAETFIKDLEREFINSGTIRVVQNSVFREKMREERADQQEFATPESAKRWGRELGADFMIFGTINSIVDSEGKRRVNFYQINLELADLETNELVWIGDKKIKKYIVN